MTISDTAPHGWTTQTITIDGAEITLDDHDGGRPFLVLHGGGGAATVRGFADLLAQRTGARVVVPTHPGFGGTARPDSLTSTRDLAAAYIALLDELELTDVTVLGNSFGGWIAAEMALIGSSRLASVVIADGVGIVVDGHPVASVAGLAPADLAKLSFHDPAKAPRPPAGASGPSPDIAALISYTGPTMSDATLRERLGAVDVPVQVVWGESDGIVDLVYGKAYAEAIPGSVFTPLPRTGHLPQIESPEELLAAITAFSS
jgi:pimeloyl-ACP methyl ester carboxylesterase